MVPQVRRRIAGKRALALRLPRRGLRAKLVQGRNTCEFPHKTPCSRGRDSLVHIAPLLNMQFVLFEGGDANDGAFGRPAALRRDKRDPIRRRAQSVSRNRLYFRSRRWRVYTATLEIAGTSSPQAESMTAFSPQFGGAFFVVSVTCPAPLAKE